MSSQPNPYINDIARRFLRALEERARVDNGTLQDFYQTIFPHNLWGPSHLIQQGYYYIPYHRPPAVQINENFYNFWNLNTVNIYCRLLSQHIGRNISITTPLDEVVGEAVHTRLSIQSPDYRVYAHQAEAIILSLYALDSTRAKLRRGSLPTNLSPVFKVIADLAETAGGKTEVFETLSLQLVLDCKRVPYFDVPKVLVLYPMKALMVDHFRRFLRDTMYVNEAIRHGRVPGVPRDIKPITIGVYCGDTPENRDKLSEIIEWIEYLLGEPRCPLCGQQINTEAFARSVIQGRSYTCPQGHVIGVFRVTREQIRQWPPDILFMTPDMLNNILTSSSVVRDLFLRHHAQGYPILIVLDEPHEYTGVLGSNISMLLREFEDLICVRYPNYQPLYLVTSATIPRAEAFLVRLFLRNIDDIITVSTSNPRIGTSSQTLRFSELGIVALLPNPSRYGIENAAVEIPVVLAACMHPHRRKILVFVDSVEWAENLERQIRSYVERDPSDTLSFWYQYNVPQLVQQHIFEPDVYPGRPNPGFIRVAVLHARLPEEARRKVENEFKRSPPQINILITTPAMEIGVDIGDVDAVILVGLPPTPVKFVQRVGRTGRRGGSGLVIIIGNDKQGYDTFYLINYNNLGNYLRLTVDYELPINPLNLEVIRCRFGNYTCYMLTASRVMQRRFTVNYILSKFRNLAINYPLQVISSTQTQNLPSNVADSINRLRSNAQWVHNNLRVINRDLNIMASIVGEANVRWCNEHTIYMIRNEIYSRLGRRIRYFIDDLRSTSAFIKIKYYLDCSRLIGTVLHEEELDVKIALTLNSVFYVDDRRFSSAALRPWGSGYITQPADIEYYISPFIFPSLIPLRGTIKYRTLVIDGQRLKILLEACGLRGMTPRNINNYYTAVNNLYNNCINILQCNAIFDVDAEFIRLGLRGISIQPRRLDTLSSLLQHWLKDAQNGIVRLIEPLEFYYEAIKPTYWRNIQGQVLYISSSGDLRRLLSSLGIRRSRDRAKLLLYWRPLEFLEALGRRPSLVYKLLNLGNLVRVDGYNASNQELYFIDNNNQFISYNAQRARQLQCRIVVTDQVSILVPIVSVVSPYSQPQRVQMGLNQIFEVKYYDSVSVYLLNYGAFVKPARGRGKFKYIGKRGGPYYILGYSYETKALCIEINWQNLNLNVQDLLDVYCRIPSIGQILNRIPNRTIINDFKIRVTHSISHIILNFHSIYSGGNPWDIGEYMEFEKNESGDITKSRIFIYDFDEGGNGVSEIIGAFLPDIIHRALIVIHQRRSMRGLSSAFRDLAAPGDLLLGRWPVCPYGNSLLGKEMLVRFFEILTGQLLQNIINQPQVLQQYIPRL